MIRDLPPIAPSVPVCVDCGDSIVTGDVCSVCASLRELPRDCPLCGAEFDRRGRCLDCEREDARYHRSRDY